MQVAEKPEPHGHRDERPEDEPLEAPGPCHDLAGRDRADDETHKEGKIWYPDSVADEPITTWNQRGRKTTVAKKPNAARKMAVTETVKERIRKVLSGTMGSGTRDSTNTKAARNAKPSRIRPPTLTSVQSAVCALVNPTRMGTSAAVKRAAPM